MKGNMWALDIETYPDVDMIGLLPEVTAKASLVDTKKIEKDIADKKASQVSKMALNPLFGKIACICVFNGAEEKTFIGLDEEQLLKDFWAWLVTNETNIQKRFITFNGKSFDMPFVFKRLAINGVVGLDRLNQWNSRYGTDRHLDIKTEWYGHTPKAGENLNSLSLPLLGQVKTEFDVTKIKDLIESKEGQDSIAGYCMTDTKLTFRIADKLGYVE